MLAHYMSMFNRPEEVRSRQDTVGSQLYTPRESDHKPETSSKNACDLPSDMSPGTLVANNRPSFREDTPAESRPASCDVAQ